MKSAVDFIKEQLSKNEDIRWRGSDIDSIYKQAKQMEKQQIIDAAERWKGTDFAEKYYAETYGSKGSDEHIVYNNEMVTKSEKPILLYDTLKKIADFWHGSEIPKPIFKQYLHEHNLNEIVTSSQTEISDEEIEKSNPFRIDGGAYNSSAAYQWSKGARWYREQLKRK